MRKERITVAVLKHRFMRSIMACPLLNPLHKNIHLIIIGTNKQVNSTPQTLSLSFDSYQPDMENNNQNETGHHRLLTGIILIKQKSVLSILLLSKIEMLKPHMRLQQK